MKARKEIDEILVFFKKNYLEAGTLGLLARTQVVISGITSNYFGEETKESLIPECLVKFFPYKIEHIISFIQNIFKREFVSLPQEILEFVKKPLEFVEKIKLDLNNLANEKDVNIIKLKDDKNKVFISFFMTINFF